MSERKVKGTMLVEPVKMIRKNKDKNWESVFTPKEWETINSRIMDSIWYPLELYMKCGAAVYEQLAKKDTQMVRRRGKERGKELFNGIYRSVIFKDHPFESLKKFVFAYKMFFNFSTIKSESLGDNHAQIHHDFDELDHDSGNNYCHHLMGVLESLMELSGVQSVKISLSARQWEGSPSTIFDIQWA